MHFLLLLLRLVLDQILPTWRDGLKMAARADGRVEHIPTRSSLWDRWLDLLGRQSPPSSESGREVRRGRGTARLPDDKTAD